MSPDSLAVLIAVDDPFSRQSVVRSLRATGFVLDVAANAREALPLTTLRHFDIVLVEFESPELCRELRAQSPSLRIVAVRADGGDDDEWNAIESGADDFLAVPFRYREAVARLGAVLRRPRAVTSPSRGHLRVGVIELDLDQQRAFREGKLVHLTPHEFSLLAVMMSNAGAALTHVRLARTAWRENATHTREYVRTYIQSLRQKLERNPSKPDYIRTHPWVGYRFVDPSGY